LIAAVGEGKQQRKKEDWRLGLLIGRAKRKSSGCFNGEVEQRNMERLAAAWDRVKGRRDAGAAAGENRRERYESEGVCKEKG
jgi:hypothetical protein